MFSPDIVESDAFLEMPISSQALYFHLGMFADDDGFVNPRKIMRMIGVSHDDLHVLTAKRFVLDFESGVIVIKHWKMNNLVRKDWYRPTQYEDEKKALFIKKNGSYTLDESQAVKMLGDGLVNESLTVRPRRLGKVSIGKVTNTYDQTKFDRFWLEYPNKKSKKKAEQVWRRINPDDALFEIIMAGLSKAKASSQWKKDSGEFVPHPTTWLHQERWNDEVSAGVDRKVIKV